MSINKKLYRSGPYADLFSQGVQVGNALYMAGQVGTDESGQAPDDLVEQMSLAYGHVKDVLSQFDANMDNIVDETWFVTDIDDCMAKVEELFIERQRLYDKAPEVSQTLVQVAGLVDPSFKIEIKCIAVINQERGGMSKLKHLPADADVKSIVAAVEQDGAVILDNVISEEFIAALREETDPYMDQTVNGEDPFAGFKTTRTGGLMVRSSKCRDLIEHETVLNPCREFLAPFCERVQLHLTQIIRIRPGETAQAIHRDKWAWGKHLSHLEPQFNTIWAITDFTNENGATQVVPGSTIWLDDQEINPKHITQAEMKAGSVLIYSGSVFHGGGANNSDGDRIGINITYALGWLRQEENQYLTCPPEHAKDLSPSLQELAGYAMGQYALGYFTPPGNPGESPETVPPLYALGVRKERSTMGNIGDLDALERALKT